jgi:hypothetical protein
VLNHITVYIFEHAPMEVGTQWLCGPAARFQAKWGPTTVERRNRCFNWTAGDGEKQMRAGFRGVTRTP